MLVVVSRHRARIARDRVAVAPARDENGGGFSWRLRDRRLPRGDAAARDIKDRLRSCFENATVFQQAISLECAGETDLPLLADLTKGGDARSRRQCAVVHQSRG